MVPCASLRFKRVFKLNGGDVKYFQKLLKEGQNKRREAGGVEGGVGIINDVPKRL